MCPKGIELYRAWAKLVPQIKPGDKDIKSKVAEKTTASERARLSYQEHCINCKICHHDTINGFQYAAQQGFELPNAGKPRP